MSLKTQIEKDIKSAMLNKKKAELTALRAIKSAILLAQTEKGASEELDDLAELNLLTKQAKQRKDAISIYEKEKRDDLAIKERLELEVISRYLPKPLSEEEIKSFINEMIKELNASGLKDMGKVMGLATKTLAGKADGKVISSIVKTLLGS